MLAERSLTTGSTRTTPLCTTVRTISTSSPRGQPRSCTTVRTRSTPSPQGPPRRVQRWEQGVRHRHHTQDEDNRIKTAYQYTQEAVWLKYGFLLPNIFFFQVGFPPGLKPFPGPVLCNYWGSRPVWGVRMWQRAGTPLKVGRNLVLGHRGIGALCGLNQLPSMLESWIWWQN